MENKHRNIITTRLVPLVNSVYDFEYVLAKSLDFNIFTQLMINDITDPKYNEVEQKRNFFINLTTRGPEAFEKLILILHQTNHEATADILTSEHSFPDSATSRHRGSGPFTESRTKAIGVVNVKKASAFNEGNLHDTQAYKMTSNPKGLALIIVNKHFSDPFYETRDGADEDYRLTTELFQQLGYEIFPYVDKTSEETEIILGDFLKKFENREVDSCIVAISTHGEENGFVCNDSNIFPTSELIQKFNNQNCPSLKEKPKMFFIQACRGNNIDAGVPLVDRKDSKSEPARAMPFPPVIPPYLPSTTDIIVVYPTQFGYVAFNNEPHGSWFFNTLTRVFMENAYKVEFLHLLNEVSNQLSRLRTHPDSEKQSTEVQNLGWRKKLYFNPGLYK